MSEDRQSTESLPAPAEASDAASTSTSNSNSNASPPARAKAARQSKPEKSADEGIPSEAVQSAPMTASNSTSSEDPLAVGPYSTRSRGRHGRINYAEDIDMDFELTSPAPSAVKTATAAASAKRHSLTNSPATTETEKGPAASTRKGHGHAGANGVHASSAAKDMIPGTSSFSANAAANGAVSRKRKQPHANNGSAKRLNGASEGQSNFRLSNMMTFENCGARLKNGKLKADDGTTLEVNGEFSY